MKRCLLLCLALCVLLCLTAAHAFALDAQTMELWMDAFADALGALPALNDAAETADPSRPGEYLIEYAFGTVLARSPSAPKADEIIEIDAQTEQVTDCRGVRVGMPLERALDGGAQIPAGQASLAVLGTQDAGLGWSWAYISDEGVYGVEYITYGGEGADMREYTLTYVIGGAQTIEAIRIRVAEATQAQAEDGMRTAEEIASRQQGEAFVLANGEAPLQESDLTVDGRARLGESVADFVAALGDPVEVQTLPGAGGRLLLYEGAVLTLAFDEYTSEEVVTGVSVNGTGVTGPRGLAAGMDARDAAARFRCDADVSASGGTMYLDGEAEGEAPYGVLLAQSGGPLLRYACPTASGEDAVLEIGVEDGKVAYWQMRVGGEEAQDDG